MRVMPIITLFLIVYIGNYAHSEDIPNFSTHIAPILNQHCVTCHRPEGGAPFNFLDPDEAQRKHKLIAYVTESKQMPPWKISHSDFTFSNARGLNDTEIQQLQAWSIGGAPMGDLGLLPKPPTFSSAWNLGEPDMVLEMEEEYRVPADGPDIYRNFVIALPQLPKGTYIKAMEFRPAALSSAHHALIYLDTTGDARRRDEESPGVGYSGMSAIFSGSRIEGWAIGTHVQLWPDGVSLEVPPNADLLIQEHFHPTGKEEIEKIKIGLHFTDEPPTRLASHLDVPFAFGVTTNINIPPGEANYIVEDSLELRANTTLTGLFPHAHMVCRGMESTVIFPDGAEKVLLRIDDWDFAWQERYIFSEELQLPAGTVLKNRYWYDNSSANPANPHNPPQQVTWGPDSTDEMACFTYMLITDSEEQKSELIAGYRDKTIADIEKADFGLIVGALQEQGIQRIDRNDDGRISLAEMGHLAARMYKRVKGGEASASTETSGDDFGVRGALRSRLAASITDLVIDEYWHYALGVIVVLLSLLLLLMYLFVKSAKWATNRIFRKSRMRNLPETA